jgi:hypothetical protein
MPVAHDIQAPGLLSRGRLDHQISFRDVPAGRVRCVGCGLLFTLLEFLASPDCLGAGGPDRLPGPLV